MGAATPRCCGVGWKGAQSRRHRTWLKTGMGGIGQALRPFVLTTKCRATFQFFHQELLWLAVG